MPCRLLTVHNALQVEGACAHRALAEPRASRRDPLWRCSGAGPRCNHRKHAASAIAAADDVTRRKRVQLTCGGQPLDLVLG